MPIVASPQELRQLAQALELLDEVEAKTGVRISPNMRLELGVGDAWVSVGKDSDGKHVLHDRIGD